MKNLTSWRILPVLVFVAIIGGRIYTHQQQKKARAQQEQMFRDLARYQAEQAPPISNQELIESILPDTHSLDSMRIVMDSIGEELSKSQEEFEKRMEGLLKQEPLQ